MGNVAPTKDIRLLLTRRLAVQHTFVIREYNSPTPLGDIGLQASHLYPHGADLGYVIIPQIQGRSIVSETVRVVCQYTFEHAGMMTINAYVLADNKGSIRALEKIGFIRTQVLEKAYEIDGIAYDNWVPRLECDVLKL